MQVAGGKYLFGTVKVSEKGQIVIPKEARTVFGIKPGDTLMLLGDEKTGLALITDAQLIDFFGNILLHPESAPAPIENPEWRMPDKDRKD